MCLLGGDLPAAMKSDPGVVAAVVEGEIQGSHVALESQPRRGLLGAVDVVVGGVHVPDGELAADGQVATLRQVARDPGSEAERISVIAALGGVFRPVEVAVEVHFFAGIVLVDVLTVARGIIDGVFDREDAARGWMLGDTDRVAEPPSKTQPICIIRIPVCGDVGEVERLDLTVAGREHFGSWVNVGSTSPTDQKHAVDFLRYEKGSRSMVVCIHARHYALVGLADSRAC